MEPCPASARRKARPPGVATAKASLLAARAARRRSRRRPRGRRRRWRRRSRRPANDPAAAPGSRHRFEPLDALLDRWMGVEEMVELERVVFEWIRDVQRRGRLVRDGQDVLVRGDLAK